MRRIFSKKTSLIEGDERFTEVIVTLVTSPHTGKSGLKPNMFYLPVDEIEHGLTEEEYIKKILELGFEEKKDGIFREKILEAMEVRGVKAVDLANKIGATKGTVSLFLSGKSNLNQTKLEKAFEYLGISLILE